MLKSRKTKVIYIIVLVFSITALSVGFAAFSASLNLASSANVKPNSTDFGVKFSTNIDSVVEDEVTPSNITSGLTASNGVIDNTGSPKLTNLSVDFTSPGQYVEYSFYAYNDGEYNAYLNSVSFYEEKICTAGEGASESLVVEACKAINMKVTIDNVEYTETTPVTDHILNKKTGEQINLRIEYDSNGEVVDGNFSVKLQDLILVYSTINDATYVPDESVFASLKLFNVVKENAVSDIDVNFGETPTTGTYIRHGTENDSYPIYYYRGAVTNNNLKFAGFCWKIVRTTETGGVKLIYNGVPTDGMCDMAGQNSTLSLYGTGYYPDLDPYLVGYMNGVTYSALSQNLSRQTETYIYGNDVTWDGSKYTLVDTMESSSWSTDRTNLAKRHHYTCFSTSNTCTNVYYIHYFGNASSAHYLTLENGKNIEDVKQEMFANDNDSNVKAEIDSWYEANMVSYTSKLEDTVWCNDRSFYSGSLKSKDDAGTDYSYFGAYGRNSGNTIEPSLSCTNELDRFTVNGVIGNGKLTYPVGLLTADEATLAGSNNSLTYLYNGNNSRYWTMSPYAINDIGASTFTVGADLLDEYSEFYSNLRPAISLRAGIKISEGDGSTNNPYIVE